MAIRVSFKIATLSVLMAAAPALAQTTSPPDSAKPLQQTTPSGSKLPAPSIAIVDVQYMFRNSAATHSIRDQLDKQTTTYQQEFQKRDADLRGAEQALQQQRASMTTDAFNEKRMTLETQSTDLQHEFESRKRQIDDVLNSAQNQVLSAAGEIIEQIRQERGLNLVLRREAAIALTPELDLTAEVLQRLDKKLPRVAVSLPAAPPAKH